MAKDSYNVRRKRRVKRNLSQARKSNATLQAAYWQAHSTLLMVVQQQGGSAVVDKPTMQNVLQNLRDLTWRSAPSADGESIIITLVNEAAPKATPDLTITQLDAAAETDAPVDALVAAAQAQQTTGEQVI